MAALPYSGTKAGDGTSGGNGSTQTPGTRLSNIPAPTQVDVSVMLLLPTPVTTAPLVASGLGTLTRFAGTATLARVN